MSAWWSYRPSDLLMFSASSYERLLARMLESVWPLHLVMAVLGLALCVAAVRRSLRLARAGALVLALVWAWIAWGFFAVRLSEISTAAPALAVASALQAVWMLAMALARPDATRPVWCVSGLLLLMAALAWPWLALATGRGLAQVEWFGLAPEPTALATLGWLLASPLRGRVWAAIVPALVLAIGVTTLWLLYGPA